MSGLSGDILDAIKRELSYLLPKVRSSDRVEAMARGLGWPKWNSLLAAAKAGADWRPVDDGAFWAYLSTPRHDGAVVPGLLQRAIDYAKTETHPVNRFESGAAYISRYGLPDESVPLLRSLLDGPGGVVEFTRPSGPSIVVRQAPFQGTPILVSLWAGSVDADEPRDFHPGLRRLRSLDSSNYSWDTEEYRSFCNDFGLDKDHGRPRSGHLTDEDVLALNRLNRSLVLSRSEADQEISLWLYEGLRYMTGDKVSANQISEVRRMTRRHLDSGRETPEPELLGRFANAILAAALPEVSAFTVVRFLPSKDGDGYLSSVYGGYSPGRGWYANVGEHISRSYAVKPDDLDEDSAFENFVLELLRSRGVTILDPNEVEDYLVEWERKSPMSTLAGRINVLIGATPLRHFFR